jgi:hypothetical protein
MGADSADRWRTEGRSSLNHQSSIQFPIVNPIPNRQSNPQSSVLQSPIGNVPAIVNRQSAIANRRAAGGSER